MIEVIEIMKKTQVLVVGAGPVGLCAAYILKRHGIGVTVIEKKKIEELNRNESRAITLCPRTLELLDSVGLYELLLKEGQICRGLYRYISQRAAEKADFYHLDGLHTELPYILH